MTTLTDNFNRNEVMQYDKNSRLTTQVYFDGATRISTIIDIWDVVGRKTKQTKDGVVTSYSYDGADRLTGQQVASGYSTFVFDPVGSLLVKSEQGESPLTMTYDAAERLTTSLQGSNLTTYTFDNNGNMTLEELGLVKTTYIYDRENRLSSLNAGGSTENYTYQGDGMRRTKNDGTLTTFIWNGSDYLGEVR